jgi:hypothetical protein
LKNLKHRLIGIVLGIGFAAALLLVGAAPAHAQYRRGYYYPPPPPPPAYGVYRQGLVLGFGLGFGALSAEGCGDVCGGAFSAEGHIGGMLNPQLALVFDAWTTVHPIPNTDTDTTNTLFTGALQFWVTPIFWLKGGVGLGYTHQDSANFGQLTSATGTALMGAGGIEILQRWNFALDLQARLGHTFYSQADGGDVNTFAFMVGFNWY